MRNLVLYSICALCWACSNGSISQDTAGLPDVVAGEVEVFAPRPDLLADTSPETVDSGRIEVGEAGPEADEIALPEGPGTVLLLDYEMRNPISWSFLVEELEAVGHEVRYRRWFPHLTLADVVPDAESGALPFQAIVLSSGNSPSEPSPRMRTAEIELLVQYVEAGGSVVLLIRNTWLDGYGGDSEWFGFNRFLQAAAIPVRVARNTAIGFASTPNGDFPPHHFEVPAAYPGSLEWTLNYPVGYPAEEPAAFVGLSPYAAGVTATVQCDGDAVSAWAWTHQNVLLWSKLDGSMDAVSIPLKAQPLVVAAPTGFGGTVLVAPRSLAQLPVHTEYMSDKPILDLGQLDAAEAMAAAVFGRFSALVSGTEEHANLGCHAGADGGLLQAVADGFPALGDGPQVAALFPPSTRPLPQEPPEPPEGAPPLADVPPPAVTVTATPDWYRNGRARIGWGGAQPYAAMKAWFEHAKARGIDAFIVGADGNWLINHHLAAGDEPPPFADVATAAEDAGVDLFLGVNFILGPYWADQAKYGKARGAYGQELEAPPPLQDDYWKDALEPLYLGAAEVALDYPGIKGIEMDLELYGAGSLWYPQGFAFDPDTLDKAEEIVSAVAPDLTVEMATLEPEQHLPWLVDRGLMGAVYNGLEDIAAIGTAALRDATWAVNPDLELISYGVMVATSWFYYGWMRGLGTPERPTTLLSYDIATNRARARLVGDGVDVRIVGGMLGVLFAPDDLAKALVNAGSRADGYWLFQFTDFPYEWSPEEPPKLHGTPDEYWQAIGDANATLDALPASE